MVKKKTVSLTDWEKSILPSFEKVDPALLGLTKDKVAGFLAHVGSSSRRRTYPNGEPVHRWQDNVIEEEIPQGASVLDLGCGEGELLAKLKEKKQVRVQGVELDSQAVFKCVERGVPVFQANLDEGLKGFRDESFDYVVLEETLQTLRRPIEVLKEMLRVGSHGIVSFPNFGYWRVRLDLAVRGAMPVTEWLPYRWYDSPNIHLFTIRDFMDWAEHSGVRTVKGFVLDEGNVREFKENDNLYAEEALLFVERDRRAP